MTTGSELRRKLLWLIGIRAFTVTAVLGPATLVPFGIPGEAPEGSFIGLIGLTYALTLVYRLTVGLCERRRWLVEVQLGIDACIITAIIGVTGGVGSYFTSLYFLPVIAASIVRSRRAGLLVAGLSAVAYVWVVAEQYAGWPGALARPAVLLPPARVALFTVGLNVSGFVSVAILSGYLAEGLRRASTEIADLQALNQHVIESLTSGLVTTDREGRILTFNPGAEAITGMRATDVSGRGVEDVLQLPVEFTRSLDDTRRGGGRPRVDYIFAKDGGDRIEVGLSATPLVTSLGQAGFVYTFRDVTDPKKLERATRIQQRLAAVGEMAAGIAHEIRNPLASMSGSIQILRRELTLTDEQVQLMDIVLRESGRLNDSIRSLLDYARPQRFATTRLDVRALMSDTALLLRNSSAVGPRHSIEVQGPETGVWYEADEGQIRQVIWNLASNGLRAMPEGGRLVMSARDEQDAVVLMVGDEGVGIPADRLDEMRQPFRGAFPKGSGLGLAIVDRIASDYGGELEVRSSPGAGTTVSVRLPASAMARSA